MIKTTRDFIDEKICKKKLLSIQELSCSTNYSDRHNISNGSYYLSKSVDLLVDLAYYNNMYSHTDIVYVIAEEAILAACRASTSNNIKQHHLSNIVRTRIPWQYWEKKFNQK